MVKRGRKPVGGVAKDPRIIYKRKRIESSGRVVYLDGKGNPDTKILKVYKLQGDVRAFEEAIQDFCITNGYTKAIITF